MKTLYNKKGQSMGAIGAVITLITGVAVAVLVLIFVGTLGGSTYQLIESDLDSIGVRSVINQSFTPINGTEQILSSNGIVSGTLSVLNGSSSIGLGNFTIDYADGSLTLIRKAFNNTALKATYTGGDYTVQNHVKESIIAGFNGLEQTGSYLPIIVLAVVISLVLALVLGFMVTGRGPGDMSAL